MISPDICKTWCIFHSWPKEIINIIPIIKICFFFLLFPFKKEIKQTTKINQEKPVCVAFHFFASVASAQGFSCFSRVSLERQPRRSFGTLLRRSVQRRLVATLCLGWKLGWDSWRWKVGFRWFVVCLSLGFLVRLVVCWFWLFVGLQPSLVVVGVLFFFFLLWVGSMFPMETLVWFWFGSVWLAKKDAWNIMPLKEDTIFFKFDGSFSQLLLENSCG